VRELSRGAVAPRYLPACTHGEELAALRRWPDRTFRTICTHATCDARGLPVPVDALLARGWKLHDIEAAR
jgi:hypothetical protein